MSVMIAHAYTCGVMFVAAYDVIESLKSNANMCRNDYCFQSCYNWLVHVSLVATFVNHAIHVFVSLAAFVNHAIHELVFE